MADRQEDGPQREDAERHEVERIMRAAEALGHEPSRVARALNYAPLQPAALQETVEVRRRPALARLVARTFARRS